MIESPVQPGTAAVAVPGTGAATATPRTARRVWKVLGLVASATAFLAVLGLFAAVIVIPKIVGTTPLTVLTSSMEPGLPPGTLIVLQKVDPDDLAVGDIATYQIRSGEPGVITHRVAGISFSDQGRTFVFKGDNNSIADEEAILPEQIVGRLWYSIPWIGYLNNLVHGPAAGWVVPTLAVGLLGYAGFMIVSGLAAANRARRVRRRTAKSAAQVEPVETP